MSTAHTPNSGRLCACDNCDWMGGEGDAAPLDGPWFERLDPGGEVPAGMCPEDDCGALVYLVKEPDPAREAAPELLAALRAMVYDTPSPSSQKGTAALMAALAALAKAEGRAPGIDPNCAYSDSQAWNHAKAEGRS